MSISLVAFLRTCLVLGIFLQGDNVLLHHAQEPSWCNMDDDSLRLWYLASLHIVYPADASPHADRWMIFFHVHSADRETEELFTHTIVPWLVDSGAPLFLV